MLRLRLLRCTYRCMRRIVAFSKATTMSEMETSKWQPVFVMIRGGERLECQCGALAVMVVGTVTDHYNELTDVDHWCQACYIQNQHERID
jgi:hypothetical protein